MGVLDASTSPPKERYALPRDNVLLRCYGPALAPKYQRRAVCARPPRAGWRASVLTRQARRAVEGAGIGGDARQHRASVARAQAEFSARLVVDVNSIDAGNHRPAAPRIFLLTVRHVAANHLRRVTAQFRHVIPREWRRGADDVSCETG